MTIQEMAMQLWPCWMLGIMMICLTYSAGYKELLRIEPKAILKFVGVLAIISVFRFILMKFLATPEMVESTRTIAHMIPWQALFGVFWEDACHSMPLVLIGLMFSKTKLYKYWSKVLLIIVMLAFASGHIYQGVVPAAMISFYIPLSMKYGQKYGFGTVMICHILYDLSTLLAFRWMLG